MLYRFHRSSEMLQSLVALLVVACAVVALVVQRSGHIPEYLTLLRRRRWQQNLFDFVVVVLQVVSVCVFRFRRRYFARLRLL